MRRRNTFFLMTFALVAACLQGCRADTADKQTEMAAAQSQSQAETRPQTAAPTAASDSALGRLLATLATGRPAEWLAFDEIEGVTWTGPRQPSSDAPTIAGGQTRSGRLLLLGFGENDLPDGQVGASAGVRRGNEGEAGVTLEGDATHVASVGVNKFYAEDVYRKVIDDQLSSAWGIELLADGCTREEEGGAASENVSDNAFYVLSFEGSRIYAEARRQDGGNAGPGNTIYEFTIADPASRISALGCQRKSTR